MSRQIALAVAAAAIPSHLKSTAVILALHGDDDGDSIFPGLATVARLTSKQPDTVKRDIRALFSAGVLAPGTTTKGRQQALFRVGGRGRLNIYRINCERLSSLKLTDFREFSTGCAKPAQGRAGKGGVQSDKGGRTVPLTSSTYMTDQSTTQVPRSSAPDDAGEGAPSAQKPAERRKSESADYHRLADEARQLFASDEPPTDETDLAERLKWIAARLHIERFQPAEHRPESSADLVARVAASEWFKHEHLAKARRACGLATTKGA